MKIAVIQMLVGDDKLLNLDRACDFVAQAAQGGAQVAVLPEMFNCPYKTENFPVYAEKAGGHSWQRLSDAACICVGRLRMDVEIPGGARCSCGKIAAHAWPLVLEGPVRG